MIHLSARMCAYVSLACFAARKLRLNSQVAKEPCVVNHACLALNRRPQPNACEVMRNKAMIFWMQILPWIENATISTICYLSHPGYLLCGRKPSCIPALSNMRLIQTEAPNAVHDDVDEFLFDDGDHQVAIWSKTQEDIQRLLNLCNCWNFSMSCPQPRAPCLHGSWIAPLAFPEFQKEQRVISENMQSELNSVNYCCEIKPMCTVK